MTNFRLSNLKEVADDNFKFDENGREFLKRIENTMGKKKKLLVTTNFSFSQCFQELYYIHVKPGLVRERVNIPANALTETGNLKKKKKSELFKGDNSSTRRS